MARILHHLILCPSDRKLETQYNEEINVLLGTYFPVIK